MKEWTDRLSEALGEEALSREEVARILGVSREVAHRVERKLTPLAAFLLGSAVGRSLATGATRQEALAVSIGAIERLLPPEREQA